MSSLISGDARSDISPGSLLPIRFFALRPGLIKGNLGATDNRIGLFLQGCKIGCRGCMSRFSWDPAGGEGATVGALLEKIREFPGPIGGATISGGEPTEQSGAVVAFMTGFRKLFPNSEVEIVVYSGRLWRYIRKHHPDIIDLADVVISGPYVHTLPHTALTGSSNQEVHLLSPLAKRLYKGWEAWPTDQIQIDASFDQAGRRAVRTFGITNTERLRRVAESVGMKSVS